MVLAGSLPPKAPDDFYAELIKKAKPYFTKPNLAELKKLFNKSLEDLTEIIKAGKELRHQGIEIVVISLGGDGSIILSEQGIWQAKPPQIEVQSTVGAGDTLVYKLEQGSKLKEAVKYATAASANSVSKPSTLLCEKDEVEKLLTEVEIIKIDK